MARLWSTGFELNTATTNVELESSGSVSPTKTTIVTSPVRSGTYACKCLVTGTDDSTGRAHKFSGSSPSVMYARAYIYIVAAPDVQTPIFMFSQNLATGVYLNTDRTLQMFYQKASGFNNSGSASSALNLNQWYRVEIKQDRTNYPTSIDIEAKLDGVAFATTTPIDPSGATTLTLYWGIDPTDTGRGAIAEVYFDDIAINDGTGAFQNSYPGSGKIIHLKPNAAGDANSFAVQVGGTAGSANNFTRVDEITPDDATSYNGSLVLNQEDLFSCDDSGIGSSDTVNVVSVGVRMADLVGADATAGFKLEIEKASAGTKSQSANLVPNSTSFLTNAPALPSNYPITLYQDPDSSAWTQTTLDSMQIGYILDATNVQTIAVSTVWALVDYTPSGATPTTIAFSKSPTVMVV